MAIQLLWAIDASSISEDRSRVFTAEQVEISLETSKGEIEIRGIINLDDDNKVEEIHIDGSEVRPEAFCYHQLKKLVIEQWWRCSSFSQAQKEALFLLPEEA